MLSKTFKKSHHIVNETRQENRKEDTLLQVTPSLPPSWWGHMFANLSAITTLMGDGFFTENIVQGGSVIDLL